VHALATVLVAAVRTRTMPRCSEKDISSQALPATWGIPTIPHSISCSAVERHADLTTNHICEAVLSRLQRRGKPLGDGLQTQAHSSDQELRRGSRLPPIWHLNRLPPPFPCRATSMQPLNTILRKCCETFDACFPAYPALVAPDPSRSVC
jgi:hypothetical protein